MNIFRKTSYRSKIFLSLILVSIITIFISSSAIFTVLSKDTEAELIETYALNVSQVSKNLSYIFLDMLNIANALSGNEEVSDLLREYTNPEYVEEQIVIKQSIESLLPQRTNNYIVGLETIIVTIDKDIFYSGAQEYFYTIDANDLLSESWIYEANYTSDNLGYVDSSQMFDFTVRSNYFYITRNISDSHTGELQGAIRIGFDSDYIQHLIANIISVEYTSYIINDSGYVLCSNNEELLGSTLSDDDILAFDSNNSVLIESAIDNTPWRILVTLPHNNLPLDINALLLGLLISILLALIVSGFISFFVSQSIATPINNLTQKVKAINIKGYKQLELTKDDKDEITLLTHSIEHMERYMDDIMDNLILKERQKDEAEVNFLRMQISPHFLHNTLKTIPYLVKQGRLEENTAIVTSLTTILRESMIGSSSMIPLSKELDLLKKYLLIMQVRYDYSFDFSIEEFPAFADILIPRLTLQPLVENAVFHATSDNNAFLHIRVNITDYEKDSNSIHITIEDDGCGIDENQLSFINKTIEHYELFSKQQGSIGVPNVAKRLKYYYQNPIMYFESELNKGTCVNLIIDKCSS